MDREKVARIIELIIKDEVGYDGIVTEDMHFVNDLQFDSLDSVELIMKLEDEFSIAIDDEQLEKIMTVRIAIDHVYNALCKSNIRERGKK